MMYKLTPFLLVMFLALSALGQGPVVELNKADLQALISLPGIGPKKAEAIIRYRQRRPFTRKTQLLKVKGIGHKIMKRLLPRIIVTPIFQDRVK